LQAATQSTDREALVNTITSGNTFLKSGDRKLVVLGCSFVPCARNKDSVVRSLPPKHSLLL
jgi:hypothetical protein